MSAIRAARQEDFGWILALSALNEIETSPLDRDRLGHMAKATFATRVMDDGSGYLIAFDQDGDYASVNFHWFKERYPRFLYIDRIVIAASARGLGLGRLFYEDMSVLGRAAGHGLLGCEVNLTPPNPGSDSFHARMGFDEAGHGDLGAGKTVRYLVKALA